MNSKGARDMTERPVRTEMPNSIELTVVNKFRREIWSKFLKGIKEYQLIQAGDKIAVCISGGKDSMLMALCMKRLQRYDCLDRGTIRICDDPFLPVPAYHISIDFRNDERYVRVHSPAAGIIDDYGPGLGSERSKPSARLCARGKQRNVKPSVAERVVRQFLNRMLFSHEGKR